MSQQRLADLNLEVKIVATFNNFVPIKYEWDLMINVATKK